MTLRNVRMLEFSKNINENRNAIYFKVIYKPFAY